MLCDLWPEVMGDLSNNLTVKDVMALLTEQMSAMKGLQQFG